MPAPTLQFKRGLFANLPGLKAGEPGFTTDSYELYVGIDSTTQNNKFFGSHRYWTRETTTTLILDAIFSGFYNLRQFKGLVFLACSSWCVAFCIRSITNILLGPMP